MPSLTELTVCSWMKSSDRKNDGTVFSYAVPGMDNEFLIFNYRNFKIHVKGASSWVPIFVHISYNRFAYLSQICGHNK